MTEDSDTPTEGSFGRYDINRRNILKGIGTGAGLGVTGALTASATSAQETPPVEVEVEINVKPGSDPNAINCRKRGVTPVAILTTDGFDATTVDPASLRFGKPRVVVEGGGAEIAHPGGHMEDAKPDHGAKDGDADFIGHFPTQETGFSAGDTMALLVGKTEDGTWFVGRDSVKLVGKCPEGAAGVPEKSLGVPVEQTTEGLPAPPAPPDESPEEGLPVSEEEFEELKERASTGDVPQPPRDEIQSEGGESLGMLANGGSAVAAEAPEVGALQQSGITVDREFPGWNRSEAVDPPDTNIAVGPGKVVLAVNLRWGIYDKDGGREFEVALNDWFDPVLDATENFVFDPKTLYDHHEDRFVLMAVARDGTNQSGSWVVAVSDDSNPFGTWWLTKIPHGGNSEWVDYPGFGVDENGIYLTANIFDFQFPNPNFQFAKLATLDKTPLYDGNSFTYWWFDDVRSHNGSRAFTIQPTHDMPGTKSGSGGNQYLVSSRETSGSALTLYELRNPTSEPRLATSKVDVSDYTAPPNAEQPNTSDTLDTVGARLMNATFENGSVWTVHSITFDWDEDDGDASAILKWYEIDVDSESVAQSRGWGRPGADYFFPTIATDGESTMIVYNESDKSDVDPRIEVAGRTAGYTQNSLEAVSVVKFGESEYDIGSGKFRWGDYSGIVVDPEIQGYWAFSEYAKDDGNTTDWETWVGEAYFEDVLF